jgi:hypothetical protein
LASFGGCRSRCSRQKRYAGRCFYHLGHEGAYCLRPSCHGATDGAVGPEEHSAWGAPYLVGFEGLPVFLEHHIL